MSKKESVGPIDQNQSSTSLDYGDIGITGAKLQLEMVKVSRRVEKIFEMMTNFQVDMSLVKTSLKIKGPDKPHDSINSGYPALKTQGTKAFILDKGMTGIMEDEHEENSSSYRTERSVSSDDSAEKKSQ
jgi:hypothetical protein